MYSLEIPRELVPGQVQSFRILDKDKREVDVLKLRVVGGEELERALADGEAVFRNCFLYGVDLERFVIDKVNLKRLDLEGSVVFAKEEIQFKSLLVDEDLNLRRAKFFANEIVFSDIDLTQAVDNFHGIWLIGERIRFEGIIWGSGEHDFKNSRINGQKEFLGMKFYGGEVQIVGVDFGDGDVIFSDCDFSGSEVLFRMSVFGRGKKIFSKIRFRGDLNFERVDFGDGDFLFREVRFGVGHKVFRRSTFGAGSKSFVGCDFSEGDVEFTGSDFGTGKFVIKNSFFGRGSKDFHYCHFGDGDVIFDRVKFGVGVVDFRAVDFDKCRVVLSRIEFERGDFIFEATQLQSGYMTIRNSVFGRGEINFKSVLFSQADLIVSNVDFGEGAVIFNSSEFRHLILRGEQIDGYVDLRVHRCEFLDLADTVIKDIVDLQGDEVHLQGIDLRGVRLLGRIYIDWQGLNVRRLILSQESTWKERAEQFRMLKENFHNLGMYQEEDLAYVEYKRAEAYLKLEMRKKQGSWAKVYGYILFGMRWLIMDAMSLYATSPIRVLFGMGVSYLFFSFLYLILELVSHRPQIISSVYSMSDPRVLGKVGRAFYHSAITFLTIGYGDYYPCGVSRILSPIEGFLGLFMMSYFTVAFVRKILR